VERGCERLIARTGAIVRPARRDGRSARRLIGFAGTSHCPPTFASYGWFLFVAMGRSAGLTSLGWIVCRRAYLLQARAGGNRRPRIIFFLNLPLESDLQRDAEVCFEVVRLVTTRHPAAPFPRSVACFGSQSPNFVSRYFTDLAGLRGHGDYELGEVRPPWPKTLPRDRQRAS
jgi:hypothetical protein